jgi:RNA polymerase sigma-70 factor (ECF subfamily)
MAGLDVESLYRKYGHSVLRRARQILSDDAEAEEVLQEIFVSLLTRPEQFGQQSSASTFLYAVTTHACLARLRNRKNRLRLLRERVEPSATEAASCTADTAAIVRDILARLPDEEAHAAVHYHLDGMTHAEIAEVLGCSRRHVGDLLERVEGRLFEQRKAS